MNMFGFTISLLSYIIVKLLNDCEYIKIIYVNSGQRRGYESDLRSNGHFLSSSENKSLKKIRPVLLK